MNHQLYFDAITKDLAFHTELMRVYGHKAGDARYKQYHDDAAVAEAKLEKIAADRLWLAEMRRTAQS